MALNELVRYPEVVPMIPGTGVQFLDFGFSIRKETPVPKDWGFFDRGGPLGEGPVPALVKRGDENERGVVSYSVDVRGLLQLFNRVWMPLPFFRTDSGRLAAGPTNWVRGYLVQLDEPDRDGNDFRLVVAVDTALLEDDPEGGYLAPSFEDARNGMEFTLPSAQDNFGWFYGEAWVRKWCLLTFKEMLDAEERRRRRFAFKPLTDDEVLAQMQGPNEHLARYMALVDLLHALDILPRLSLVDRYSQPRPAPIDVDLVLDLGNSRSCGLLIESDSDQLGVDITKAVKLQIRDLGLVEQVYSDPFPSRFEFARAQFGRDNVSIDSTRDNAFSWPTAVRVGVEAERLAGSRSGTEGSSGLSSPKRYLWDDDARRDSWRFNGRVAGQSDFATGVRFTTLVNDVGEPLHRLDPHLLEQFPEKAFPAIHARYARRNLTAFALAEIFVHALAMMNSPTHRLRRAANAMLPRRLRRIIMSMPTAMPVPERHILKSQAEAACELAYLSLGLAEVEFDDDGNTRLKYSLEAGVSRADGADRPEVILQWDEATATQAVYLYTQIAVNHSGDARRFFEVVQHPQNRADAASRDTLRLATIDLGGGTTDLVVTQIGVEGSGAHVTLVPDQLFREGFNIAGDDVLLRVVREHVIGPLRAHLKSLGMGDRAEFALNHLLGGDRGEMSAVEQVRRQQFASRIAAPIGLGLLAAYERYDPAEPVVVEQQPFAKFFDSLSQPSADLLDYFNAELARHGAGGFKLESLTFPIDLPGIDRTVRSALKEMLQALGEVIRHFRADLLILSGRPSRFPAVRAILQEAATLPPHRVLPLHEFRVGQWYPFRDYRATVGDPKTTAAVGAMICLLGNGQLTNFNFRSHQLRPRSTARFFGKIDKSNRLLAGDEFYDDLDLDNPDFSLSEKPFEFHGPMPLGFRQLAADWWPATRFYSIDYATPEDARALSPLTPLRVTLNRPGRKVVNRITGEEYIDNPGLGIYRIEDRNGRTVPAARLRLRLQTIGQQQGYWLDTGILLGN